MKIEMSGLNSVKEALKDIPRAIPYATAIALTKTGQSVKAAEVSYMSMAFDRPTPYTIRSLQLTPATKDTQTATVWFKGRAKHYLESQVYGGGRELRAFERHLQAVGAMPYGTYAVIPKKSSWAARIDQYGNLAHGQIVQLLSYFQASELWSGHTSNMKAKGKERLARKEGVKINGIVYFIANGTGKTRHLYPGIWAKRGTHGADIAPVLLFVNAVSYKPRLDYFGIAEKIIKRDLPINARLAVVTMLKRFGKRG